jgi:tRNA(Ile)-lysidine synthase
MLATGIQRLRRTRITPREKPCDLANARPIGYKSPVDLTAKVQANIRQHKLLDPGTPVLLAISGGVDSMVLLRLLHTLAGENKWSLNIAHFNHQLRAEASDADEAFVRATASRLQVPFHSAASDVRAFAQQNGLSIEMAARELRHQFLVATAKKLNIQRIALAHHADDNIETFWLRLLRGDVGAGLAGIRWQRPAGPAACIHLIRPLLNIPKTALLEYASQEKIEFREDLTNRDPTFLRNRLRLELLPQLEQFQPALREITLRAAEVLAAEKSFLEAEARRWLTARDRAFFDLHLALQREILRVQIVSHGFRPTFELIEDLRRFADSLVSVSPTHRVRRTAAGDVILEATTEAAPFLEKAQTVSLTAQGRVVFDNIGFEWELVPARGEPAPGVEFFDADTLGPDLTLRHWQAGDRFQPIGLAHDAKLQDLFTNQKLPPAEKRRRTLATSNGNIFWVEGLRISERHKVTPASKRILRWTWRRLP